MSQIMYVKNSNVHVEMSCGLIVVIVLSRPVDFHLSLFPRPDTICEFGDADRQCTKMRCRKEGSLLACLLCFLFILLLLAHDASSLPALPISSPSLDLIRDVRSFNVSISVNTYTAPGFPSRSFALIYSVRQKKSSQFPTAIWHSGSGLLAM